MSKEMREQIDKIKNFGQFLNEGNTEITTIINTLKDEYYTKFGINPCDINKGECMNFSDDLSQLLNDTGYKSEILTTDLFLSTTTEMAKADTDEIFYDDTSYNSIRPTNFKWLKNGYHSWLFVNNKHYDADATDGVKSFYDLPIFKMGL